MTTRKILLLVLIMMVMGAAALSVQAQGISSSIFANCPEGSPQITNGVEIIGNVRPGEYRITVIGINGFDPVMAVVNSSGNTVCNDDSADIAGLYEANLPPDGNIPRSGLNSGLFFRNRSNTFQDFSIVVAGFGGQTGEALVILEDLRVTTDDGRGEGAGDPFGVRITQNMLNSGQPIIAYMLGITASLDPLIALVANDQWVRDSQGNPIVCDDGGVASRCYNTGSSLNGALMVVNDGASRVVGDSFDSMLIVDPALFDTTSGDMLYFHFTSFNQQTTGDYVAAFRIPIGPESGTIPPLVNTPAPLTTPVPLNTTGGVSANGSLSATAPEAFFTFSGMQGETVTITAQNTSTSGSGIDTVVELLNPQGIVLISNDDHGSNDTSLARFDSRISNFSLPVSGAYFIRVTSFSGRDSGTFQVTVNKSGTPTTLTPVSGITATTINQPTPTVGLLLPTQAPIVVQPSPTPQQQTSQTTTTAAIPISYGQSLTGELAPGAASQNYTFSAAAGDVVTITMRSTGSGSTLDARLFLFDPSGTQVADHDDVGASVPGLSARDARISEFTIPAAGTYRIQATSFAQASFGTYELTLELAGGSVVLAPTSPPVASPTSGGGGLGQLLNLPTATPASQTQPIQIPSLTNTLSFDSYNLRAPADWTSIETDSIDVIGNAPAEMNIVAGGGDITSIPANGIILAIIKPDFLNSLGVLPSNASPSDLLALILAEPDGSVNVPVETYTSVLGMNSAIAVESQSPAVNGAIIGAVIDGDLFGFVVFSAAPYDAIEPLIVAIIQSVNPVGAPLPAPSATQVSLPPAPTPRAEEPLSLVVLSAGGGTFRALVPPSWLSEVASDNRILFATDAETLNALGDPSGDVVVTGDSIGIEIYLPQDLRELTGITTQMPFDSFVSAVADRFSPPLAVDRSVTGVRSYAVLTEAENSTHVRVLVETPAGVIGAIIISNVPFDSISDLVAAIMETVSFQEPFTFSNTPSPTSTPASSGSGEAYTLTLDLGADGEISFDLPAGWVGEYQSRGAVTLASSSQALDAGDRSDPIASLPAGEIAIQIALPLPSMLSNFGVTDPNLSAPDMLTAILNAAGGEGKVENLSGLSVPAAVALAEIDSLSAPVIAISVQYDFGTVTYAVYANESFSNISSTILAILDSVVYTP